MYLPHDPSEPEEEHHSPDVEKAGDIDALHPAQLDPSSAHRSLFLILLSANPVALPLEALGIIILVEQLVQGGP